MPPPEPAPQPAPPCPNCGHRTHGEVLRFCPACGQETRVQAPTLREFAQQFGGAYFSTEGAIWRTLALLLFKPGELTRLYLIGRRKHYVLPLRLYLTISVLVLLAVRLTGGGVQVQIPADSPAAAPIAAAAEKNRPKTFTVIGFGTDSGMGLREGVFYCKDLPGWLCARARRYIDIDRKALPAELEKFRDRFMGNLGSAMFMLLPTFAFWLKLVYINRRLRYTEHLVFALHVHAFWFLALGLIFTDIGWLVAIGMTAIPVYTVLAMRRVYGGRRWPRLLRAALVSLLYSVVMIFALTAVALWSLLV